MTLRKTFLKRRRRGEGVFFAFVALMFLASSISLADQLSLEELHQSLDRHPLLLATQQEQQAAEAELLSALGSFDPLLRVRSMGYPSGAYDGTLGDLGVEIPTSIWGTKIIAGARESSGEFPVYEDYEQTNDDGELRFGIEIPLLRDGKIDIYRSALEKAKMQKGIASANIAERRIELKRLASLVYWDWVAAGNQSHRLKDLFQVAKERQLFIEEAVQKGDQARFAADENSLLLIQRKAKYQSALLQFARKAVEMSLYLRDEDGQPRIPKDREVPSSIPQPSFADRDDLPVLTEKAIRIRPELARIAQERQQNAVDTQLMENQILPRLDLKSGYARDYGQGPWKAEDDVKMLLSVEFPLLNRSQRGRLAITQAKALELFEKERYAKEKLRVQVEKLFLQSKQLQEQVSLSTNGLKIAERVERGERERFDAGDSNLIFVNLREQNAAEAKLRLIDTLASYHQTQAELNALTSDPSESLVQVK